MFLKSHSRQKDGKRHQYYSLVESVRTARGPQHRTLAYLGELNGSSEAAWRKTISVFNGESGDEYQLELFPSDTPTIPLGGSTRCVVSVSCRYGSTECGGSGRGTSVRSSWLTTCGSFSASTRCLRK